MADRYWVGGSGNWNTSFNFNWSSAAPLEFTASRAGNVLTTVGSPALAIGRTVWSSTFTNLGTITGGSGNTWTTSASGTVASQTMSAATSGASAPTVSDSVFFTLTGAYTVTFGAPRCLNFTVSNGAPTFSSGSGSDFIVAGFVSFSSGTIFSITSNNFYVGGSFTLAAGVTYTSTATLIFNSTVTGNTIITNGIAFNSPSYFEFNGNGGQWTLGGSFSTNKGITITQGTFNTGNYNLTATSLSSGGSLTRSINLGSSTITLQNISLTATGLTFNAGTSNINFTPSSVTFNGGSFTFYNVNFTSTVVDSFFSITSPSTFNNLTISGPATIGQNYLSINSPFTINGTFSTTGTAGNRRIWCLSGAAGDGLNRVITVNSAPSITDVDFQSIYFIGSATPISGTRIGNRGFNYNINFDAPKIVYWNLAGAQNWSANGWSDTPTGTPSTNFFPLPQDIAKFTDAGSVTGTISLTGAFGYVSTVDMSGRTSAMTLGLSAGQNVYGNWINGSGTTFTGTGYLQVSGGGIQTITSAGIAFPSQIGLSSWGGTLQLADALITTSSIFVNYGTFDTKGYAVTATQLISTANLPSVFNLGASVITLSSTTPLNFTTTNFTLNAGTSQINATAAGSVNFNGLGFTYNNVSFTSGAITNIFFNNLNTFNNLTFAAPSSTTVYPVQFGENQIVNGTLTCAGGSAVQRIFMRSGSLNTQRTLTVNSISATDCDFRDIIIAGAASGSSPTRAGNCGNNSGITFLAPKTVYWNLAGTQNWSATAWAISSGGTPDINQFPLAQDTAVFDNTGAADTITIDVAWNIGTFDASSRTSATTFSTSTISPSVYGDWKFGTGVTSSSTTGAITFQKYGTQIITSNGVQFGCPITVNNAFTSIVLADALSLNSARTFTVTAGNFDAVTYNVTTGSFSISNAVNIITMGSGTWTLSGTGTVWSTSGTLPRFIQGTSTILLSDTSTTARTFVGGSYYYNKLTIGGTTGTSTTTISGGVVFGEFASIKTVAHTINFQNECTFGKWSVTGTVGNVVTITGSGFNTIAGPAVTGVNYLAMGSWGLVSGSPGEFYAGPNSTGTATAPVFRTAAPTPRTLYWVGGTGNWSSTTKWSTSSGGPSGAAIPTSFDSVNFDALSNATDYTATIDAGVTLARCASFLMDGPLVGNVTFAGSTGIAFHGNVIFDATGITRTYTGTMNLAGDGSYTFTTNGLTLASQINVTGIYATWTLGSALNIGAQTLSLGYGSFNTSASSYALNFGTSFIQDSTTRPVLSVSLNGSTITSSSGIFISASTNAPNLTFNAGTSTISFPGTSGQLRGGGQTFNNVSFAGGAEIWGDSIISNLSFAGRTTPGIFGLSFQGSPTISTLTLNAGATSACRSILQAQPAGTQRTLSVGALTAGAADYDFKDIVITGSAAPLTGTRFGNAGNNSGITFSTPKTVYYGQTGSADWGSSGAGSWSLTNGGALDATAFPLAQDTAVFPATTYPASGSTTTINTFYSIGTVDMSARTSDTMTLATGGNSLSVFGDWINGTGITLTGTGTLTFAKRATQNITSAGKTFPQPITVNSPSGSVVLQDNFSISNTFTLTAGTFNANSYSFTATTFNSSGSITRTIAFGSGAWTLTGTSFSYNTNTSVGLTVTGSATINMSNASAKTFNGGSFNYSNITLNQAGAGTLTVGGNNTFKNITSSYSATGATTIDFGTTTTRLSQFTATGYSGRVLTISGILLTNPANLILTQDDVSGIDFLSLSLIRAFPVTDTWYSGKNSTLNRVLGWIPISKPVNYGRFFLMFG